MYKGPTAKRDLERAARLINESLVWIATPQGSSYWDKVFRELVILANNAPPDQVEVKEDDRKTNISVSQNRVLVLHIFDANGALCGLKGDPSNWPSGHQFVRLHDKDKATCQFCKAKAPL